MPEATDASAGLRAEHLTKAYRGRRVVDDVTISVEPGEIVGLLGSNGAGKTTTFNMVVGLTRPDSGRVMFHDTDLTRYPMYKRARLGVGYLPQEASVFRRMTVRDNLLAVAETLPIGGKAQRERVDRLLESLGLTALAKQKAYTLSGGERRRVEIGRALVLQPEFLLLDEPFSGVDPKSVAGLQDLIAELKQQDLGILITDHSVRETLDVVDRAYLINEGTVVVSGSSLELVDNPVAKEVYLGEKFRYERHIPLSKPETAAEVDPEPAPIDDEERDEDRGDDDA